MSTRNETGIDYFFFFPETNSKDKSKHFQWSKLKIRPLVSKMTSPEKTAKYVIPGCEKIHLKSEFLIEINQ